MAKRRSDEDGGQDIAEGATEGAGGAAGAGVNTSGRAKPVHEERIGRVKATCWANQSANGVRHNVTFKRIFKREGSTSWEQSDSFGRDDLPLVMEVARLAWLWIYAHGQG